MCADSLLKIDVSSMPSNNSKGKSQIFTVSKYGANALNRFSAFYDEAKFTDSVLTAGDHRK